MNNFINHIRRKQLTVLATSLLKQTLRQPAVLFWGILFPILMALGLGIAFTQQKNIIHQITIVTNGASASAPHSKPHKIDTFLNQFAEKVKPEGTETGRYKLVVPDEQLGRTTYIFRKTDWRHAMALLKRGQSTLILKEQDDDLQYHFDPLNSDAQLIYLKLSKLIDQKSLIISNQDNIKPLMVIGTRYIDFLVPGLMAMGIMMSIMWGMSYSTIEKRSKKLLRRMVATPMKKPHFLLALMTVRIIMNSIEALLLFIFAYLVFDIHIQGSLPALIMIFIAGNLAFGGIAVFMSSRTDNTEIGNGLVNAVVMPMMVLSGIFFSYQNFPKWSIPFIEKLPLTLLADSLRSVFIEAAGMAESTLPCLYLLGIGLFFFILGLKIFKWY